MVIGQIGRQRPFDCFIIAEGALEHVACRAPPVADDRPELEQGTEALALITERIAPARKRAEAGRDLLHVAEHAGNAAARRREAIAERRARRGETIRQPERLADRATAHLVERAGRHPLHGVEHAQTRQHVVLRLDWIVRIGGLVQRGLDHEIAGLVGGGRSADRGIALEQQHLAAAAREQPGGGQAAEAAADHDDIVAFRHAVLDSSKTGACRAGRGVALDQ